MRKVLTIGRKRLWISAAATIAAAGLILSSGTASAATSADSPSGFWYGTDSFPVTVSGSSAPYKEPVIGGTYGGYIGMIGDYARSQGSDLRKLVMIKATTCGNAIEAFAETC